MLCVLNLDIEWTKGTVGGGMGSATTSFGVLDYDDITKMLQLKCYTVAVLDVLR